MFGPTDYDDIADRYAAGVDERPWNALYERPATLEMLPAVAGLDVLDAGCGPGWYTCWLAEQGARVVGIDLSGRMVEIARRRLADELRPAARARARVARVSVSDLRGELADAAFDLIVSSLVIHYVEDLHAMFREWARVLRPGGTCVLSTHHPVRDMKAVEAGYLRPAMVEEEWPWLGTRMRSFHRPLAEVTEPLLAAGFTIEDVRAPGPTEAMREVDPKGYARLVQRPAFLFVRARRA